MRFQKVFESLLVLLAILVIVASLHISRAAATQSADKNQAEVSRFLKHYESLQLNAKDADATVRETGRLTLATSTRRFELQLVLHDLRTPNYRAEEVIDGGAVRNVEMSAVHTYRGNVIGMEAAEARFTIDVTSVEGVIITPNELYYFEPLRHFSRSASANEYIAYTSSDVMPGAHGACATVGEKVQTEFASLSPKAHEAVQTSSLRQAELATEADYEYVSFFGSSAAANAEILSIMNQVDGLYRQELGITFSVSYQHTWATSDDPYSATAADQILYEFTNYWNANLASQPRDLAHMWTNRTMQDNIAGIAWLGTVCADVSHSYGVSLRISDGIKYAVTAHEIGHNLGATHPDDQNPPVSACSNTIMNSIVGNSFDFCQFSLDEINNYVNGHSFCLTTVAPPAYFQFNSATYSAGEGAGGVVITVTRTGDTSTAATVNYATSNGTASARTDYISAIRNLTFAAGETSKTFTILLVDDLYVEGNETINVSLSNAGNGAVLGSPISAVVTIVDNDATTATTNPLDNANFFVRQHYLDFLNRESDSGGLAYWSSSISPCGVDHPCLVSAHTTVSAAFFIESEFQETGYYVYRLYRSGLGRTPQFDEFISDRSSLVANSDLDASKQALANEFVTRAEFQSLFPFILTSSQYVDKLNANTGNSLTGAERNALVSGLNNGSETRATVLKKVAENQLFRQREYNAAFVLMQYFGYLRRNPDQSGYNFWLGILNSQPNNFRGMVCSFITSAEYQLRFAPVATASNADCGP